MINAKLHVTTHFTFRRAYLPMNSVSVNSSPREYAARKPARVAMPRRCCCAHGFLTILAALPLQAVAQDIWRGVDLSYVNELEDCGAVYRHQGEAADPFEIFAGKGANVARFRLWHTPDWTSYSTLRDVAKSIRRARDSGMNVLLDFHYSDDWADPANQAVPAAWREAESAEEVAARLYDYTYETLTNLYAQGLLPDYVQVGNEVNHGLARHDPVWDSWEANPQRNVGLLNAGISAVQDVGANVGQTPRVMLHIAQPENVDRWLDTAARAGLFDFDILALSYYSQWSRIPLGRLSPYIQALRSKYGKDVVVVETAYPWTLRNQDDAFNILGEASLAPGYRATTAGQRNYLLDLMGAVLDAGGLGIVYWEPAWISTSCRTRWGDGSHWENAALFDYEASILHEGADFLDHDFTTALQRTDPPDFPIAPSMATVTFSVDMSGVRHTDGAFITGSFTGPEGSWRVLPMNHEGGNVYAYRVALSPGDEGAFYFLRGAEWGLRETVPLPCAEMWNVDRKYSVSESAAVYAFRFGTCDALPR